MLDDRHEVMTIFGTDEQTKMYNILKTKSINKLQKQKYLKITINRVNIKH